MYRESRGKESTMSTSSKNQFCYLQEEKKLETTWEAAETITHSFILCTLLIGNYVGYVQSNSRCIVSLICLKFYVSTPFSLISNSVISLKKKKKQVQR